MPIDITGQVRRFAKYVAGATRPLRLTQLESLVVAQMEDSKVESNRAGRRFHGGCQILANGIAPVQAIPTTTATLALFNGESDTGKTLAINKVGFWVGSGTPAAGSTLFATVSPAKLAAAVAANATGYGSASSSGSTLATKSKWATAQTLPSSPTAPAWFQLISTQQAAAANVGQGDQWLELDGGLLVPPGYAVGFAILSGVGTTPLYGLSATWSELDLDLE